MWLVLFVFWQDRWPDDCVVLFFPVKFFPVVIGVFVFWHDRWLSEIYFNRRSDDCTFFFLGRIFFWWFEKHSRPDDCTFLYFRVIFFSGRNWCLYFDTSSNYGTYIRPEKNTTRKKRYSRLASHVFWRVQITTRKNYDTKNKRSSRLADG